VIDVPSPGRHSNRTGVAVTVAVTPPALADRSTGPAPSIHSQVATFTTARSGGAVRGLGSGSAISAAARSAARRATTAPLGGTTITLPTISPVSSQRQVRNTSVSTSAVARTSAIETRSTPAMAAGS
jgi:hypothetical protein